MTRVPLPSRRPGFVIEFPHAYPAAGPRIFTATIGCYDFACTKPAEIFISLDGDNAKVSVDAHDAAVALSFALQHGADIAEIGRAMLRGSDGVAHGFMGSLVDAVIQSIKEGATR